MARWKRVAVLCCIAAALAGSGWAAYEAGIRFFTVEESAPQMLPDGSWVGGKAVVGTNDPNFTQEDADRMHLLVKKAIAEGKYTLNEVKQTEWGPCYIYTVELEDGRKVGWGGNLPVPLPEPKR